MALFELEETYSKSEAGRWGFTLLLMGAITKHETSCMLNLCLRGPIWQESKPASIPIFWKLFSSQKIIVDNFWSKVRRVRKIQWILACKIRGGHLPAKNDMSVICGCLLKNWIICDEHATLSFLMTIASSCTRSTRSTRSQVSLLKPKSIHCMYL